MSYGFGSRIDDDSFAITIVDRVAAANRSIPR